MKKPAKSPYGDFDPPVIDTVDQYKAHLVRFCKSLGFETVTALAVFDHAGAASSFHSVDNTPAKYLNSYYDPTFAQVDPVMQHCKRSCQTLVWDQATYVAPGYGSLWEHQAQFGYRTGIALALHGVGGRHFFLGVDRDAASHEPADVVKKMSTDLRAFAVQARETAFRFFLPQQDPKVSESLTPTELDCLRWSMDGYSTAEISAIINVPNASVIEALYSAMRKLDCVTKYQAVIRALKLKLIS